MSRTVQITLRANRALTEDLGPAHPEPLAPAPLHPLTPLGLVVSEHVDKLGFFEPAVTVRDKAVLPDRLVFTLGLDDTAQKSLDEIVRGFRIGCFRIAREYKLITPDDPTSIFAEGFAAEELTP